ncbi:hypothetical protein [Streptomyces sp. NRRL WC-3549]|uniref:hypothetical protein n=1 Tax=Streptomyces sp. NRRL WC-3549 TaxID=1463925 RepID=UPI0004C58C7F|nr:hypothetical protein [Streptomyces sp. NRRL WC-3549]
MALVQLDLPDPMALRGRWAALAAVQAAAGHGERCQAVWPLWHYDDGHGSWADLHHLDEGRAVLLGQDRNDSETYYAEASDFYEERETDLLAGAPAWWEPPVRRVREADADLFLGFVYGFDGSTWWRAAYDADDGFNSVCLPALDAERTNAVIRAVTGHEPDDEDRARQAVDALVAADGAVDDTLLAAVVPPTGWDVAVGTAAARGFLAC